jgi:integrase/recombinase XerD
MPEAAPLGLSDLTRTTRIDDLLAGYAEYLKDIRGVAETTRTEYGRHVKEVLQALWGTSTVQLSGLRREDLVCHVIAYAARYQPSTVNLRVTAIRSFSRYLVIRENSSGPLPVVPYIAHRGRGQLPKIVADSDVSMLLTPSNYLIANGLRDRAIAMLIASIGLRAREVAQLTLDDFDWRAGTVRIVKQKGCRVSTLPLCQEVGEAVAVYLQKERPAATVRTLFLQTWESGSKGSPLTRSTVAAVIRRAWGRSGAVVTARGPHALRHSLATRMLVHGVDLKNIADVLRHRSLDTSYGYTRLNLVELAEVAAPWPEVPL